MRYSVNKSMYSNNSSFTPSYSGYSNTKKSFSSSGPLKKDGTPDMRYAANKKKYK